MKLNYILTLCLLLSACGKEESIPQNELPYTLTDFIDERDGNTYKCIEVEGTTWMLENLKYRLPQGQIEGCYTYDETKINTVGIKPDNTLFMEAVANGIEEGVFVDPPGMMPWEESYVKWLLDDLENLGYDEYLSKYGEVVPEICEQLERIYNEQIDKTIVTLIKRAHDLAEVENGNYSKTYGYLYTPTAAAIAVPEGWQIPTDEDWTKLENALGLSMAHQGVVNDWRGDNLPLQLLFTESVVSNHQMYGGARPNGVFIYGNGFINKNIASYYWTSTSMQNEEETLYFLRSIRFDRSGIYRGFAPEDAAYSVRCVKK